MSWRGKGGGLTHQHRTAWLNCIYGQRGRRMYLKSSLPVGEQVIWLNVRVIKAMVKFLEEEGALTGLSIKERDMLFGQSRKEKIKGGTHGKKTI